jgi:hypothetical protein
VWRTPGQAIRERPIRLLVVLGLPVAVVVVFQAVIWVVGWGWHDGRGDSQFRLALLLTMLTSLALFWVSTRLWSGGKKPSPLSSPRALWRAIKQRPIRMLSVVLMMTGSILAVHVAGVCLFALLIVAIVEVQFGGVAFSSHWSEVFGPMLLVTPVVAAGAGSVWLSLRLWDPSRKIRARFLVWLLLGALFYAIGYGVCASAFLRPPVP